MKSNTNVVKSFRDGATSGESGNVFIDDNTIFSYGKHFPLAVRCDNLFIINGDKSSRTTAKHTSCCIQQLYPNIQIPFSALNQLFNTSSHNTAFKLMNEVEILDNTEDSIRTRQRINPKTGEKEDYQEHLLGSVLFKWNNRYFLSSIDDGAKNWGQGYFLVELPHEVKNINEAYESLLPDNLGEVYQRQGEFFFIPCDKVNDSLIAKNVDLQKVFNPDSRGNAHLANKLTRQNNNVYVKGTIRHPEHKILSLGQKVWHKVLINKAVNSWNAVGNVD